MNTIPDLVPLHDNRPGLRTLVSVEVREAVPAESVPCAGSTLDFIASTATLDRYHEVIEPAGWRLDSYRRNPVFQNAHNYGDILFTLGKALTTEVRSVSDLPRGFSHLDPEQHLSTLNSQPSTSPRLSTLSSQPSTYLFQRIEFATEVNPVARIAYGLYKGGFLKAVSVGFVPIRWEDGDGRTYPAAGPSADGRDAVPSVPNLDDSQPSTLSSQLGMRGASCRRRYLEQELLEVSAVAIPANPDALALGLKSGAIGKSDLQATLDLLSAVVGPFRRNGLPDSQPSQRQSGSDLNPQLLQIARELRRVMRKA